MKSGNSRIARQNNEKRELKYKSIFNSLCSQSALNCAISEHPRHAALQIFVNVLWKNLADTEVSWIGIYGIGSTNVAKSTQLELLAREDKPACSPIALHGVCGKSFTSKKIQIVEDVYSLGENHIVCDPRNLSEIVIPLLDENDDCWGVLDLDSRVKSSFSTRDAFWLLQILKKAELTHF